MDMSDNLNDFLIPCSFLKKKSPVRCVPLVDPQCYILHCIQFSIDERFCGSFR